MYVLMNWQVGVWLTELNPGRNWTEVLGSNVSAINSQHGRGKHDVSAYEAVYGQKMDHDFSCSKEKVQ